MHEPLKIIYQDDWLIAIDKPSGIAVHRDEFSRRDELSCVQILREQLDLDVHPIHRLDGATSGVLMFSRDRRFIADLSAQFMDRRIAKTYHAITRGFVPSSIRCDDALKKDGNPQDATTVFYGLKHVELPWPNERFPQSRYSFVKVQPETGRFHQIRRHANYLAFPLVGDTAHGDSEHNFLWRRLRSSYRLLLHASSLEFVHPALNQSMTIEASLPEEFERHLREMPWQSVAPTVIGA